ncbi:MAG: sigma-70 family RNA polymerase sigma factor [Polyangiales bacterium]|nr:sigma-70 family RNA polymerase sigma factor [Myxococcales bacterium]MCB9659943.1 sigma-70 family RNA polymerase sigma factor [Sandaracinaceae bacterium]
MDTDPESDPSRRPPPDFDALRFDAVYRDTSAFVLRSLRRLVSEDAVDDAFQDVYLVVARRLGEFEGRAKLTTWVYGIVLRVAADHRRAEARRSRRLSAVAREPQPEPQHSPEQAARAAQGRRLLHRILDAMEDPLREVFVLVELEQVPGPEVAALLELNPNTMHSRLRSARARFEELRIQLTGGDA